MQISVSARRILQLIFALSSASTALTRPRLERRLAVTASELQHGLAELARIGLLDAARLRLTLPGLALAVACSAPRAARPRARRPAARQVAVQLPVALFSRRDLPRAVA
jgi:hypothetical protein